MPALNKVACQIGLLPSAITLAYTKLQPKNKAGVGFANRAALGIIKKFHKPNI